jgi:hypothetical protein
MRHQDPSSPCKDQQFNPPPGWIVPHKVLAGIAAFLALFLIRSCASAASGHGKSANASKLTASRSHAESVISATETAAQQADTKAAAERAATAAVAPKVAAQRADAAARKVAAQKAAAAVAAAQKSATAAAARKVAAAVAAAHKVTAQRAATMAAQKSAAAIAAAPPPTTASNCAPGYDPCIPPGPDVDCAGGSGNGPRYVQGPLTVTGSDPYGLDHNHDGIGCEN